MDNFLDQQLPLGLILVFIQNWAKQQKWMPWLTYQTTRTNHLVSILLTGLATLGLHTSHTGSFVQGGSLLITWPAGTVLIAGLWHWAQQYAVTKGLYTGLSNQLNPPAAQQATAVVESKDIPSVKATETKP